MHSSPFKKGASPKLLGKVCSNAPDIALLRDNPSCDNLTEVNSYIRRLDKRLSVPKFTRLHNDSVNKLESSPQRSNRLIDKK